MNTTTANINNTATSAAAVYDLLPIVGYVVYCRQTSTIWGTGLTREQAWDDARDNLDANGCLELSEREEDWIRFEMEDEHRERYGWDHECDYDPERDDPEEFWARIEEAVEVKLDEEMQCVEATAGGMESEYAYLASLWGPALSRAEHDVYEEAEELARKRRKALAAVAPAIAASRGVAGYAVHIDGDVWGTGRTIEDAWLMAYEFYVDHRYFGNISSLEELRTMTCSPATAAAINADDLNECHLQNGVIVHSSEEKMVRDAG